MIKNIAFLLAIITSPVALSSPITALDFSTFETVDNSDTSWVFGIRFNVNEDIEVTHLGAFDEAMDGFIVDHQIGIFDTAGTLLASTTATSSNPLNGLFRYNSISSLFLTAGNSYDIVASGYGLNGDAYARDASPLNVASQIDFVVSVFAISPTFVAPVAPSGRNGLFGANFLFETVEVPAPSSLLLIFIGLAAFRLTKK